MRAHKMFKLCFLIFLSLELSNLSEARQEKKNPSAVLVGSVYCDTCFQQSFSKASHFISGAVVSVGCLLNNTTLQFTKEVSTNEHGEFKVHLPFSVSKHVKKINRCSVKLIKSSEPRCAEASTATSSAIHLKSKREGEHIFSAGFFTFKPSKKPKICDRQQSFQESEAFESQKFISNLNNIRYPPQNENPTTSHLPPVVKNQLPFPPLPILPPLPALPPLPPLPRFPFLPPWPPFFNTMNDTVEKPDELNDRGTLTQFFGPNPFLPPSLFAPIIHPAPTTTSPPISPSPPTPILSPITPTPPVSLFPPIIRAPFTSPPSLLPPGNVPPAVPDLSSAAPPPPPPVFQSLPAFPFQPTTGLPGSPSDEMSISSKDSSP